MSEKDYAAMQQQSAKERAALHPESEKYFLVTRDQMHDLIRDDVPNLEKTKIYGDVLARPASKGDLPKKDLPYPVVEVCVIALAKGVYALIKAIVKGIGLLIDEIEKSNPKKNGAKKKGGKNDDN